jgi:LmbE family N-acetylglucosaminyl deacetylase
MEGKDAYGERIKPGVYVDVSGVMETKTQMLCCHASQRDWLRAHHGMDQYVIAMRGFAGQRGSEIGVDYAEAFRQHLGHAYPQDCLLSAELGELARAAG